MITRARGARFVYFGFIIIFSLMVTARAVDVTEPKLVIGINRTQLSAQSEAVRKRL
jgi:hypothetical protein